MAAQLAQLSLNDSRFNLVTLPVYLGEFDPQGWLFPPFSSPFPHPSLPFWNTPFPCYMFAVFARAPARRVTARQASRRLRHRFPPPYTPYLPFGSLYSSADSTPATPRAAARWPPRAPGGGPRPVFCFLFSLARSLASLGPAPHLPTHQPRSAPSCASKRTLKNV